MPMPFVRDRYLEYLRMGADVVVALHPHVAENYEILEDGKMIFYSLGNFIFDTPYQRAHRYTDAGVLLKLIFTEDDLQFEAMGTRIIRGEEHIEKVPCLRSLPMFLPISMSCLLRWRPKPWQKKTSER